MKILQNIKREKTVTIDRKKLRVKWPIRLKRARKEERHSNDETSTKRQVREKDYPDEQEEVDIEMETIQKRLPATHSNLITTQEIVRKEEHIRSLEASALDELSSVNSSLKQELREQVNNFDTNSFSVSRTFFLEKEFASFF